MIRKDDCVLLLTQIEEEKNISVKHYITKLMTSDSIPEDILKFINDNRQLDLTAFYKKVRKSYNANKSNLYKNLVRETFKNPEEVLKTLASLSLQILLFTDKVEDKVSFLKHSRFEEVTRVLNNYSKTYDLRPCLNLLYLIKSDIKILESISR